MYEGKRCRNCGALLLGPLLSRMRAAIFRKAHHDARLHARSGAARVPLRRTLHSHDPRMPDLARRRRQRLPRWPAQKDRRSVAVFRGVRVRAVCLRLGRTPAGGRWTDQPSVFNWQEHFSGFVAARFLFIFWFGTLWYVMFPAWYAHVVGNLRVRARMRFPPWACSGPYCHSSTWCCHVDLGLPRVKSCCGSSSPSRLCYSHLCRYTRSAALLCGSRSCAASWCWAPGMPLLLFIVTGS